MSLAGAIGSARVATARRVGVRLAASGATWARADGPSALAAMALSLLGAALTLRLWRADLRVPFAYPSDALFFRGIVKAVVDHGWYEHNPSLGAPFGQNLLGYPGFAGDHLHMLTIKAMSIATSNPAALVNLYFLLGFPLVALTAFVALRALGASRTASVVAATIYALAPYHFYRAEGHPLLAVYYSVPLGCLLAMRALAREPLLAARAPGRAVASLAICLVVGTTGVYYASFTIMLLVAIALIWLLRRDVRAAAAPFVLASAIALVLAVSALPNTLYRASHSDVAAVDRRVPAESETYGLKLTSLLLPISGHRLAPLAHLRARYDANPVPSTPTDAAFDSLGAVASIGFLWICAVVLGRGAGVMRRREGLRPRRYAHAGLLAVGLFAYGTLGGGSALFAYIVTPQLRGPNRVSIMIAFLALVGVALLLDALRERLRVRGTPPLVAAAALGALLVLAVLDQTSDKMIPAYAASAAEAASDHAFVHDIERQLPPGAAIVQLPYVPYPENPPVARMADYDLLRGYTYSSHLRWSYGQLKGSLGDWQARLDGVPIERWLPGVAAAGFDGVYVDRFGYADDGAAIEGQLRSLTGQAPLVSWNKRLSFFSLTAYRRRVSATRSPAELAALRDATVRSAAIEFGRGFLDPELGLDGLPLHWETTRVAKMQLVNPLRRARTAILTMTLVTTAPAGAVDLTLPGGASVHVPDVAAPGATVRRQLTLPAGTSTLTLRTDTPASPTDVRGVRVRVVNPLLHDTVLEPR